MSLSCPKPNLSATSTTRHHTRAINAAPRSQVYEGVAALHARDFKRAAELLLDSIATFTT